MPYVSGSCPRGRTSGEAILRSSSSSSKAAGGALVLLSAFGFGMIPIFARFAYRGGISVATLLAVRFLISSPLLFAYLRLRGESLRCRARLLPALLGLGLLYTAQSSFYFSAVKYIPASLAALILYTYPAFVCILSALIDRERIGGQTLLALLFALGGLIFILGSSFRGLNLHGLALATGAALVYSFYIILAGRTLRQAPALLTGAYVTLFAAGFCLLAGLAGGSLSPDFSAATWLPILGIILISTLTAILAFFRGLRILGSQTTSILSTSEPIFTITGALLLFGDSLTLRQLAGGALIMAGALLAVRRRGGPPG
jgi:drug/metabolite transporter (DMT)-like permease